MSAKHRIYRTPLKTLLCEALCSRPLGDFAWYPGFFNAYIIKYIVSTKYACTVSSNNIYAVREFRAVLCLRKEPWTRLPFLSAFELAFELEAEPWTTAGPTDCRILTLNLNV